MLPLVVRTFLCLMIPALAQPSGQVLVKNERSMQATKPSDREIVLTRTFAAPRQAVFDALTQANHDNLTFRNTPPYGLGFSLNDPGTATFWQAQDEAVVNATKVSVTAMQVSFDHNLLVQHWLRLHLRRLFR
jgi:hypothetical protein